MCYLFQHCARQISLSQPSSTLHAKNFIVCLPFATLRATNFYNMRAIKSHHVSTFCDIACKKFLSLQQISSTAFSNTVRNKFYCAFPPQQCAQQSSWCIHRLQRCAQQTLIVCLPSATLHATCFITPTLIPCTSLHATVFQTTTNCMFLPQSVLLVVHFIEISVFFNITGRFEFAS